jgi:peptide-methionine (S)-S-oxide reductase
MGLTIDPSLFPDPEYPMTGAGERSIVLGGGCFWCTEAVYKQLDGVIAVRPGYAGDAAGYADYQTVSTGRTNHAEVVEVVYDADRIGLGQILKVFFSIAHDPTQKDRQGPDIGRQYRSAIFYADEEQKRAADAYIAQLNRSGAFDAPIVTEVVPLEAFYEAEGYHHDYAARNPNQPYIQAVSDPKVKKLKAVHGTLLKGQRDPASQPR